MSEAPAHCSTPLARAGIEAAAAGLVLGYGALAGLFPAAAYVPANLAAAGAAVWLAGRAGVSFKDMGLERSRMLAGLRLGLITVAPIAAVVAIGVAVPWSRHYFLDSDIVGPGTGRFLYEMLVRVPFGTALPEEVVFRGALLGLYLQRHRPWTAVAMSSAVFGLWHILPTLDSLTTNAAASDAVGSGSVAKVGVVAGVVAITALAGAAFSWLRLRCGSVVAPFIAHTALNSLAFLGGRTASYLDE